ncbi:hypothetical protein VNO78_03454 [Psophocarpus tetragonolobus]|uniref:PB1 domain-containing protein n=1 Tax=Psophocarpus tetragonolobus TaxID=3891 RepID=A0AAN9XW42_PSOTE
MGDESPKNKVKFLCSYGGKVLPRPSDGVLRYVGGETRVVCVARDVTYAELMKKVSSMVEGEMVIKYQLDPEDLDALVSVKTEEDVKHMIEEHDRHQTGLLRAFLFPPWNAKPTLVASEPYQLDQRYIDAINGIMRTSPRANTNTNMNVNKSANKGSASASACSSPKSTSPDAVDQHSPCFANVMQRVRSSPNLSALQLPLDHHHPPLAYPSFLSRPLQDPSLPTASARFPATATGRPSPFSSINNNNNNYYYLNTRQPHTHRGGYAYHDDYVNLPTHTHTHSRSVSTAERCFLNPAWGAEVRGRRYSCELMKKVSSMVEGEMVIKYQLDPNDLDALVSVITEEDVKHKIEEHKRHQTDLLRAFLSPLGMSIPHCLPLSPISWTNATLTQ